MSEQSAPETPVFVKYEDFAKMKIVVANVLEAKPVPKADKLLVLQVRIGDEVRQIVAGIKAHYEPDKLVGKQIVLLANLEPRKVMGVMSNGMVLAASDGSGTLALIQPDKNINSGSEVH